MKLEDKKLGEVMLKEDRILSIEIPGSMFGKIYEEIQNWGKAKIEKFGRELKNIDKQLTRTYYKEGELGYFGVEPSGHVVPINTTIRRENKKKAIKAKIKFIREEILGE